MIFRWSIWGNQKHKNIELLNYSILSFKKQFGSEHQYIIYTDEPDNVFESVDSVAEIRRFPEREESIFYISSKATWLKWCPSPRLNKDQAEFYIDSDVFLLSYPHEIERFLLDTERKFAVLDEFCGQSWQYGAMKKRATENTPFINAGLFVQKPGCDISNDLIKELRWWKKNIKKNERTHHDEQGALAITLTPYFLRGELYILPKDAYMLIGENENTEIESLEGVILFHAVYPEHPAFYKFKYFLDELLDK